MGGFVTKATDTFGLTDSKAGIDAREEAERLSKEQLEMMKNIELPNYSKMESLIQQLKAPELVGLLQAEELGPSSLGEISLDPRIRQAQFEALSQMQEIGKTGLTEEDMAAARQLQKQIGAQEQARQQSIMQNMERQGTGDSGLALAATLSSSQASANRAADEQDRLAQQAGANRRAALASTSTMAGNIRGQEYGQASDVARADDVIKQFNLANSMEAQRYNLGAQQNIANQQVANKNLIAGQLAGLEQQRFGDSMAKATGQSDAYSGLINQQMAKSGAQAKAATAGMDALMGIGKGVADVYTGGKASLASAALTNANASNQNAQANYWKNKTS